MDASRLWAFVNERHAIYLRKTKLEHRIVPGWADPINAKADVRRYSLDHLTDDNILQTWRFCNIFRELDTVTQWVRVNIRERYADHPHLWFMLAVARYFNWPPTLEWLLGTPGAWPDRETFRPEHMTAALNVKALQGGKMYTGAYMIRAESDPNADWYSWPKHRYIAEVVLGRLWEDRETWVTALGDRVPNREPGRLQPIWKMFQDRRYVGWGPFMAYEVVTDLRHTRYLCDAEDIMSWANAGPGALRGLNRLLGVPVKTPLSQDHACAMMRELLAQSHNKRARWVPTMEMRDIEHSLCELDKYERVRLGEGEPRARYIRGRGW